MEWVIDLFNKLLEFLYRLLLTLVDMLKDVFICLIEAVLGAVGLLIAQCLALIKPIPISAYFSAIPPEPAWMLSAIGLPQCLVMIITALTIRMLLQLIPFTRLGS
ncbi:VSK receptor [Vibrio vulnificus]|uniref:DUF2523 family protein n=1 Tax=Vibrio vulnificus TaxID=672 RepID=UPI000508B727|nr:VSK receptor [Vibrio vulnificus]